MASSPSEFRQYHRRRRASLATVVTFVLLFLHEGDLTVSESSSVAASAGTLWCPAVCDCYNNMETLDCSQRSLSVVPSPLPLTARRLYLEDNNIGQVELEEFTRSRRVSQLVLDRNRLTSVETGTFCDMTSLQELSLSANMIRSFIVSARPDCVCLAVRQLDLSLNLLATIPTNLSSFAPRLESVTK